MKKFLLAATLGATAVAGVAVAQQAAPGAAPAQKMRADANGDGNLTRQEAVAAAEARFARMDKNSDGTVTREERREARAEMRGHRGGKGMRGHRGGGFGGRGMMIERLDADKDGKLSRAEAAAPMQRMFDMADTNKDGFIDKAEADAARAKMREMRGQRGGPAPQATPGA